MLRYAPVKFWLGGGLFGQVKYVVIKIAFSKGGVMLQYAPVKIWLGKGSSWSTQICRDLKFA